MSPLAPNKSLNESNRCSDLATMAEQELSAFFNAVSQLFGPAQAELSAEDWLREIAASNVLPASSREWRQFTARVSIRLAARLNSSSPSIDFAAA
jgi:hypothetical protein